MVGPMDLAGTWWAIIQGFNPEETVGIAELIQAWCQLRAERADLQLYRAKTLGRDRVCIEPVAAGVERARRAGHGGHVDQVVPFPELGQEGRAIRDLRRGRTLDRDRRARRVHGRKRAADGLA
mgnify:CR=1 FL=1